MLYAVGSSSSFTRRDCKIKGLQASRGHPRMGGGVNECEYCDIVSPFMDVITLNKLRHQTKQTHRSVRFARI